MNNPVWYLAHPVAPDEHFTLEQNMAHTLHMVKLFFEEGWRVGAPWHTLVLVMPDNVPEYRKIGLEVDCEVAVCMKRIVLVGHRISTGMEMEMKTVEETKGIVLDLTGLNDVFLRGMLRAHRNDYANG